MNLTLTMN